MLTTYFTRNRTRTMYQAEPAGPYLDDFTHWLEQQGYRQDTIRRRLRGAAQFVAWAHAAGWHVHDLNRTLLAEFHRHLARCGQRVYPSGHPTCSDLITSAALLDYISDFGLDYMRIARQSCIMDPRNWTTE